MCHVLVISTFKAQQSKIRSPHAEAEIMRGPHEDLESYLEAVNQLKKIVRFFSTNKNLKSSIGVITHSTTLLQKASLMLEEEFRQLLHACRSDSNIFRLNIHTVLVNKLCVCLCFSKPVEPDRLLDCLPASLRPSTANGDAGKKTHADHNKDLEDVVYRPPTLVPAKVVPLLHDLAQQMLQTGQQQQVFIIYR
ncbi:putative exocyst complex component Exo70, cullin repeat-like-containing domain superfamily [Helianthus annuus]|nr:putative exocyst complex component Exo70, cullin repeat-like-containing domain superfamily [Helianthus annuus]